jgi:carbon monoxide dehydrogenase subunit G
VELSNSFEVAASPERTWALLNDVPQVVPCLPGAELKRVVAPDEWEIAIHVKLGPISMQFATDVTRDEVDEAGRSIVLSAKAREAKNRGGAEARMRSTVAAGGIGTRVQIVTELTLTGAVAQYGRGIVPEVAGQLTGEFAACLRRKLESEEAGEVVETAAPRPVGGLRLGLAAVWHSLRRLVRPGRATS